MGNEIVYKLPHMEVAGLQWLSRDVSALKVVSLHGWLDNAASFSNLSSYLFDFFHVALDLAGHGYSQHRPAGSFYHLWDYVLDVVSILNQSKQSVWLIGHSMGLLLPCWWLQFHLNRVIRLIILDNMGPLNGSSKDRGGYLAASCQ